MKIELPWTALNIGTSARYWYPTQGMQHPRAATYIPIITAITRGPVLPSASSVQEEPEAAKKRTRKKKTSKEAKVPDAAAVAAPKKATKKGSAANGSKAANGGVSRAGQNGEDGGVADPWGPQQAGGEWQPIGSHEGEWETVSHKRSKPRKERTAADDANAIPGSGL